ncbi:RHS repeat-associated core domain-containing protein [Curtobacterium sp. 'Ferrero']|uniref:RHS repeat-associated core domain-containing protein n=1 Tax=Curtobacterium sp. 'Ferrero' TaxID=2033654 RepID=UPI001143330A|nr:RHS repeat-associated core domain-containing protein [Curtobacterium sp. 'Ferrero']
MFASTVSSGRSRWVVLALVTVLALLGSFLSVVAQPLPAQAAVTGTGGQYVPMPSNARVLNGGATTANTYRTVQVAGVGGLPSSGIGAVTLMITVADPSGTGQLFARPSSSDSQTLMLTYDAGVGGNTSNTGLLAVGDDGTIQIKTQTSESRVIIDVTGYYTSTQNGVGAGGLVPMAPTRFVDTRNGTGVPQGRLDGGDSVSFQVTGKNGIPAGAAAVALNIIVINQQEAAGWIRPSPSGGTKSTGVLNYNSTKGLSTSMSAQVALGSDGKITLDTASGAGLIDVLVDVQGYFLPSNPGGGFTPQAGRLVDTRSTGSIASGATFAVQVGGVRDGVPTVAEGLSAVALTFTAVNSSSSDTYAQVYADGAAVPSGSAIDSDATSTRSNMVVTPVGANGAIRVRNSGPAAMNYVIDLQGTYNSLPGGPAETDVTGQRSSATTLPFPITDQTNASVDVGTGNLLVTTSALSLPGVTQNTTIGAAYNSRAMNVANSNTMDANRWQYALGGAGDLSANAQGVVYTDAVGTAWQFTATGAAGSFTTPAGLQQTLTRVDSGSTHEYTLKGWTSNATTHFNLAGQPTSVVDRNGNQVRFNTSDGYRLSSLVSTAGTAGAKTANSSYANGTQTFTQTSGSSSRKVSWTKNSNGDITTYTDATGAKTTFAYTNGDLSSITAPTGGVTSFTYDATKRVTKVSQANTTAGSPGTAVTRFSYTDGDHTQVADPRSDQSQAVASAAHTTYTLNSDDLVTNVVDAAGRERSKTYNAANNGVATSTTGAAGDSGSGTTTNTYGKNSSQSLTKSTSATGSSSTADYGSGSATAYLPSKVTDSSGNSTTIGYDGVGNQTSSQSGSDSSVQAKVSYNSDGTVKSATAPGNGSNSTTYAYDANKQLSTITPPTGTSLGVKTYTYDAFGRVRTETDGRGNTTTYGYDADDRNTTTAFSDGTATVTNVYDGDGNQTSQSSATGTITNTYDQRNRLVATVNTAGGGTVSYGYDLAGNIAQVTDSTGTVTHTYDPSEVLTATTYPTASGTAKQIYLTDPQGRRTDTWLGADTSAMPGVEPSTWSAHQKLTYDKSGKVTRVQAWAADEDPQLVVDTSYCYTASTTAPDCTASAANDRTKLQWAKDNITGQVSTYAYQNSDGTPSKHLTGITQTGGTNPTNWTYTYDGAGNRTEAKSTNAATGAVLSDQQLTYNAASQITSDGYTYDGTGNLTKAPGETYTYNGAQQLTSSTKDGTTTSYTYAGADMNKLLTESTNGGAEYEYTYGTTDQNGVPVIATRAVAGTGAASVLSDPVTGQPLDLRTADGVTSMYVLSGIGNPAAAIADTGKIAYQVSYDAYGAETVTAGSTSAQWLQNPYGYKTGLRSSNSDAGLTKFGYRWQSASTGQWLERDTLDAPLDPRNGNRYGFVAGDPVNQFDPTGQYDLWAATVTGAATAVGSGVGGCIAGGIVGGLTTAGPGALPGCGLGFASGLISGFVGGFITNSILQLTGQA